MKSSNFQRLNGEIYRKLQNFSKILGVLMEDKACLFFCKFIAICASEVYCFVFLFSSNDDSDIKLSYSCQKLQSKLSIADTCGS